MESPARYVVGGKHQPQGKLVLNYDSCDSLMDYDFTTCAYSIHNQPRAPTPVVGVFSHQPQAKTRFHFFV